MRHLLEQYMRPLFEGEGGGGGGGGDTWTPPEGLPSEYAGATADETLGKLLPAFNQSQTSLTEQTTRADGLRDKLAKLPGAPETIDGYNYEPGDDLKPFFGDLSKSPAWNHARDAALAAGISNEQLGTFINGVYGPMAKEGLLSAPINPKAEIEGFQKAAGIGDVQGVTKALENNQVFAKGLAAQLKGIPEDMQAEVGAQLYAMTDSAAGNMLLHALAGRMSDIGIRVAGDGNQAGALTKEDLKTLDADPRIDPQNRDHTDKDKRFDPDLRKRYDEAYARLYAGNSG